MPSNPTISKHSTLTDMKAFIRKHKLNHPTIKLSLRKAEMTSVLDKLGHLNSDPKPKKEKAKKEKSKPKFKIDQSKQPKTTPSQIKMSIKPALNTKVIKPAKMKSQMMDILMNLDIDVSNKIGDATKIRKLIQSLTRDQVATVYRKIYKLRNPGYKITIPQGRSKEKLIEDLLELNPKEEEISAKPNKTAGKGNKVYLEVWGSYDEDEDTFFESEGWKLNDSFPSGLLQYTKMLTKVQGFKEKEKLKELMGAGTYKLYYKTKSGTQMVYQDFNL